MFELPLAYTELTTLVDEDVYNFFKHHTIVLSNQGYPMIQNSMFHRIIMNAPPGYHVHHIDRNRLNAQRANLKLLTADEHMLLHSNDSIYVPIEPQYCTEQELRDLALKLNNNKPTNLNIVNLF